MPRIHLQLPLRSFAAVAVAFAVAATVAVTGVTADPSEHVVQLTADTFDGHVADGTTFVKFFAPWCGHCKRLAPTWGELGAEFSSIPGVSVATVDCTQHGALCQAHAIQGYPTLKLFHKGKNTESYRGARDLESLKTWLQSKSNEFTENGDL